MTQKMPHRKVLLTGCVLALVLAASGRADVPRLIHYQGKLRDAGGAAVTDSVDLVFRLYDDESAGNMLFDESHGAVAVTNGLFSVLVGSQSGGVPDSALDAPVVYLGVTVGSGPELAPRTQLVSTAYSISAARLDGRAWSTGDPATGIKDYVDSLKVSAANVLTSAGGDYVAPPAEDVKLGAAFGDGEVGTLAPDGTATASDVLSGQTFYSGDSWTQKTGAMPVQGDVSGQDGAKTFPIPDGYYASRTATANDVDLIPANIRTGVDLFGVVGSYGSPAVEGVFSVSDGGRTFYYRKMGNLYFGFRVDNMQYVGINDGQCFGETQARLATILGVSMQAAYWMTAYNYGGAVRYCGGGWGSADSFRPGDRLDAILAN